MRETFDFLDVLHGKFVSNQHMTQALDTTKTGQDGQGAILQAAELGFQFAEGPPLFADLSFRILPGVTLVRGGDGRGKTTLMRLLAGDQHAGGGKRSGQLAIRATSLQDHPEAYRKHVFWIDPKTEALEQMTVADFLASQQADWAGFDNATLAACVRDFDLADHLHKQLFMLSTGSKRKVFMAAAFASGAPVTLIDMPFAAVDKASGGFVIERLQRAATSQHRAWVVADYEAPKDVPLSGVIDLGD